MKRRSEAVAEKALPVWLRDMNPEQTAGVLHHEGPCALLAQAGSGKTRVLCHRIARMVAEGTPAKKILAVTFSKKAAGEMNDRLEKLGVTEARVGTWHSLCLEIVQKDRTPWREWEIDERDRAQFLLKDALGYKGLDWRDADASAVRSFIGHCKANLADPGSPEARKIADEKFPDPREAGLACEAFRMYQARVSEAGLLPFDDFLVHAYDWLAKDRVVEGRKVSAEDNRRRWAAKWDYLLVDEAQDNNLAQRRLQELLARDHRNIMVVGDVAQCIPEGQLVRTPSGCRPIEEIRFGDTVCAVKAGKVVSARVTKVTRNKKSEAFEFDLDECGKIRATAEHVMFAALSDPGGCFVYLMFRHDMGYRIGVSRTAGHREGAKNFIVRTQQEGAERLWVLRWFPTYAEAAGLEAEWAYAFGVPREPFVPRPGSWGDKDATVRLFQKFGQNGKALLEATGCDFDMPNYIAKSTGRGRVAVNILMATKDGHRVEVDTGFADKKLCAKLGLLPTPRGTMRTRRTFPSLRIARAEASQIAGALGGYVTESLSGTGAKRRMRTTRAANVHPGMEVPFAYEDGSVGVVRVVDRRTVPAVNCYDLEVEGLANFIVAGDEDCSSMGGVVVHNSIYGFRGSTPQHLAEFKGEWGAAEVVMNRNYRSGRAIVSAANRIIAPGKFRLPTDMLAERDAEGSVEARACVDQDAEGEEFATWVQELRASGQGYDTITALFRTNAQSRAFEEALLKRQVPYVVVGGSTFYERAEVKSLLGYLRVAVGRDDDGEGLRRSINAPFRFLGKMFVAKVEESSGATWVERVRNAAARAGIQARQRASAEEWARLVAGVAESVQRGERPGTILSDLVHRTGYIDWLTREQGEESVETSHAANVREMCRIAERFETVAALLDYIETMGKASRAQRADGQAGGERVLLMSIHKSKGLEWPNVWVCGVNDMVLPHARGDVEEERRLAYVAATRARDRLVLSFVRRFARPEGVKEARPSVFLRDAGLVDALGNVAKRAEAAPSAPQDVPAAPDQPEPPEVVGGAPGDDEGASASPAVARALAAGVSPRLLEPYDYQFIKRPEGPGISFDD